MPDFGCPLCLSGARFWGFPRPRVGDEGCLPGSDLGPREPVSAYAGRRGVLSGASSEARTGRGGATGPSPAPFVLAARACRGVMTANGGSTGTRLHWRGIAEWFKGLLPLKSFTSHLLPQTQIETICISPYTLRVRISRPNMS